MKERNFTIDRIRALAVLIMILTHCLVPYLSNPFLYKLWDAIHFAVPLFVFCSAYLLYASSISRKEPSYGAYMLKRAYRLMTPYYLYACAYTVFMIAVGKLSLNPRYIFSVLTATGGIDISWLVLLFLWFSLMTPVYRRVSRNALSAGTALGVAGVSAAVLLFVTPGISYKWYMWLPWSLPFVYAYFFVRSKGRSSFLVKSGVAFAVLFTCSYFIRSRLGLSTYLFGNKYPPTLLYLSHGIVWITVTYALFQRLRLPSPVERLLSFISRYSYPLFFIHYFLIIAAGQFRIPHTMHWTTFTVLITVLSLGVQWLISRVVSQK